MSSTDPISMGSLHDYSSENSVNRTPPFKKRNSPLSTPNHKISEEIQDEIDEVVDNVPELDDYFSIKNKIGSGIFPYHK